MKRRWITAASVAGLAALLYYMAVSGRSTSQNAPSKPAAPGFSLPDLDGRSVSLSDFKGKVILLDFWATWCEPCREEQPDLVALHQRFKDRGFSVVGVSMDALGASVVGPYVRANGVKYPILLSGGELPADYPVPGFPASFLIDRDGRIVRRYLGPQELADLSRDVEPLLAR